MKTVIAALLFVTGLSAQTRVAHICQAVGSGAGGGTTTAIDTTGANFLYVTVANYVGTANASDNKGNSFTALATYGGATGGGHGMGNGFITSFYSTPSSVGSGHTFTSTSAYVTICVEAWSGMATSSVFDSGTDNGADSVTGTTAQPGSISPSSGGRVVFTSVSNYSDAVTASIGNGYSLGDHVTASPSAFGLAIGYLTTYSGGGTNPAWTWSGSTSSVVDIAAFRSVATSLSAGSISFIANSTTAVTLSASDATGGSSPYSYQWYRSVTNGFTPGGGSLLSGKTSLSLADSGLTPGSTYYYVVRYTDATSSTVDSAQFTQVMPTVVHHLGFVGDSITRGVGTSNADTLGAAPQAVLMLAKTPAVNTLYSATVHGVDGSTTADWVSGSSNLNSAISDFGANFVETVCIMLGSNDSVANISADTYATHLTSTINALKTAGISRIILNYPPYASNATWLTAGAPAFLTAYQTALQTLAATIPGVYLGDTQAYDWFSAHNSDLADGVHPNDAGAVSLAYLWSQAYRRIFLRDVAASVSIQ